MQRPMKETDIAFIGHKVIEAELGTRVSSVFRDLEADTLPIAAASLGQVYRVRLAGDKDQVVAVKVGDP